LAPVTRNLLFCDQSQDGVSLSDIFGRGNLSDKGSSRTNKYQESDELWLVGVYWWVENYFRAEFVTLDRKNALDKSPIAMFVLANKVPTK